MERGGLTDPLTEPEPSETHSQSDRYTPHTPVSHPHLVIQRSDWLLGRNSLNALNHKLFKSLIFSEFYKPLSFVWTELSQIS